MIAIQIKKLFYYIKNIIISLELTSLRPTSLGPTSLGLASAGPSDDGAGAAVKMGEVASASGVDCKRERHHLSYDTISIIFDI